MKLSHLISITAAAALGNAELDTKPLPSVDSANPGASGRHIVILKPWVDLHAHVAQAEALHSANPGDNNEGVTHRYDIKPFQGFAGQFSAATIQALQAHENVSSIELDQPWKIKTIVAQPVAPYGLRLISHKNANLQRTTTYDYDARAGEGTFAYVLDTGINIEHPEFGGRANLGYNALSPKRRVWNDEFGHGTHVAGLIGGKTYGVAKKCQLIAVTVVNGRDDTPFAHILDGFQWAVNDIVSKKRAAKAVVHMSPYGPDTPAWIEAAKAARQKGVVIVIPAGNGNADSSKRSSASRYDVISVSATDKARQKAAFANFGPTVDLFAPGVDIASAWGVHGTKAVSGTAQAAGYVSGLVVYFKSLKTLGSQPETKMEVLRTAIKDAVRCPDGLKRFAYNGSGK